MPGDVETPLTRLSAVESRSRRGEGGGMDDRPSPSQDHSSGELLGFYWTPRAYRPDRTSWYWKPVPPLAPAVRVMPVVLSWA